jgi:hypothetical protein
MNAFFGPYSHSTIVKASGCATKSVADRLQALLTETAVRSVLCKGAGSDANGAFTNAKLFICLPHSCEVVKTRFFSRSFGDANLKKGCAMAALADQVHTRCEARTGAGRSNGSTIRRLRRGHIGLHMSVWKALCGRYEGVDNGYRRCCEARSGDVLIIGGRL